MTTQAKLRRALSAPDESILDALARLDWQSGFDFYERTPLLGLISGMMALERDISVGGVQGLLDSRTGNSWRQLTRCCQLIGAKRTLAYMRAAAALLPRSSVPRDQEARQDVTERIERRSAKQGKANPWASLDRRFAGAVTELAPGVRAYIASRIAEVAAEIDQAPPPPSKRQTTRERTAVKRLLDRLEAQERREMSRRRKKRQYEPTDWPELDQVVEPFVAGVERLAKADWLEVARRHAGASARATGAALDLVRDRPNMFREAYNDREWTKRMQLCVDLDRRAAQATARLPEEARSGGSKLALRRHAMVATESGASALKYLFELRTFAEGLTAVRLLVAPFVGLVPLPDDVAVRRPARRR